MRYDGIPGRRIGKGKGRGFSTKKKGLTYPWKRTWKEIGERTLYDERVGVSYLGEGLQSN